MTVTASSVGWETVTAHPDKTGRVSLILPEGVWDIAFEMDGYELYKLEAIRISAGETVDRTEEIVLSAKAPELAEVAPNLKEAENKDPLERFNEIPKGYEKDAFNTEAIMWIGKNVMNISDQDMERFPGGLKDYRDAMSGAYEYDGYYYFCQSENSVKREGIYYAEVSDTDGDGTEELLVIRSA